MGFLGRVHSLTLRDKMRSYEIRKALNVEPLLGIEISQLRCFGHLTKMPHERLVRHVLLVKPTGKRPRGHPRTRWTDYTSNLAYSRLDVEPEESHERAVDCEVFRVFLGLLPSRQLDIAGPDAALS